MITWSETFSVNDDSTGFVVLCFGDPHSLECWKGSQNWATDPDQELSFLRSNNFNFHGWWCKGNNLFAESFWDACEHSCSTTHNNVRVEIFSNVNIALKDRLITDFVEARHFLTDQEGFEKCFRASEFLISDLDDLTIRQLIGSVWWAWIVFYILH